MKKFVGITIALLVLGISLPQSASAAIRNVELVERPHQLLDGRFFDDELATLLTPEGRLGSLVYTPTLTQTRWFIDAALLDEVADMADGYELANEEDGNGVEAAAAWLATSNEALQMSVSCGWPWGSKVATEEAGKAAHEVLSR